MTDRSSQLQSLSIDRGDDDSSSGVGLFAVFLIAVIAASVGAGAVWFLKPAETVTVERPAPEPQVVQQATDTQTDSSSSTPAATAPAPRASGLVASGYVVARRQATVSAEITGRIREVLVEEGTVVEAGDVLARLDDERALIQLDLLRAQSGSAAARVRSLDAQLTEARRVHARASELADRAIGSEANVTAAQAQVDSLTAQLTAARSDASAARAAVRSQEDLVERHVVRAPFAGVVIAKNAQVGEILSPASAGGGFTRTGVATLVDMQSLELEIDVNEGQIGRIHPGQRAEARLDAYPDWRIPAHVEAIIPTADRARATIQVRVALDERDGRVLPDMAARVTFTE